MPGPLQCPRGLHTAEIKLDSLTNADRTAPHDEGSPSWLRHCLVFFFVAAIEVGRCRVKFTGAGIDHLVDRPQPPLKSQLTDAFGQEVSQGANLTVGEPQPLGPTQ